VFLGKKKDESKEWAKAGSDDRQFPRMGLKTIVGVRVLSKEANCKLRDISLGGLAFISPWQLAAGDPISIVLPPPDMGPHEVRRFEEKIEGRVCRCVPSQKYGGWQVGVRFREVTPEARALIRAWFEAFGESPDRAGAQRPSR
jgi:hypothetical protein